MKFEPFRTTLEAVMRHQRRSTISSALTLDARSEADKTISALNQQAQAARNKCAKRRAVTAREFLNRESFHEGGHESEGSPLISDSSKSRSGILGLGNSLFRLVYAISSLGCGLLGISIVSFGLVKIVMAVISFAQMLVIDPYAMSEKTLVELLHGVELLLLAPLPLLLVSSLAVFISKTSREEHGLMSDEPRIEFQGAKQLVYGIFAGLLSLNLVAKLVSEKQEVHWNTVGVHMGAVIVFGALAIGFQWMRTLEHFSKKSKSPEEVPGSPGGKLPSASKRTEGLYSHGGA